MPRHAPRPDPFSAIRTRSGPQGIVYRVSFTRHGKNLAKLFRVRDFDNARAALRAARAWRDGMTQSLPPRRSKSSAIAFGPTTPAVCPGVYLKRQIIRRGDWRGEYTHWQAQTHRKG